MGDSEVIDAEDTDPDAPVCGARVTGCERSGMFRSLRIFKSALQLSCGARGLVWERARARVRAGCLWRSPRVCSCSQHGLLALAYANVPAHDEMERQAMGVEAIRAASPAPPQPCSPTGREKAWLAGRESPAAMVQ